MSPVPQKTISKALLLLASFFFAAGGHPTFLPAAAPLAAACALALYFKAILNLPTGKAKFMLATSWFTALQLVHMFWLTSHPYNYIYGVYIGFALLWGMQWGAFSLLITEKALKTPLQCLALAAVWTLFEWSRLFFLSGYSWNPLGMALTSHLYPLQMAALFGVFGLSFWVIATNLQALSAWERWPKKGPAAIWLCMALFPYAFGIIHVEFHRHALAKSNQHIKALLVQTAFPAEEALPFNDKISYIAFVLDEWQQILHILRQHVGKEIDIIALPEYVVPFATFSFVYPYEEVKGAFTKTFGERSLPLLPPAEHPFAKSYQIQGATAYFVNNAFWIQAIANIFNADVVAGLEDVDPQETGSPLYYSSAQHFKPHATPLNFTPTRYAKRILLPMAEYIPSTFFKQLAARYGIGNSFTPGKEAVVMQCGKVPFGVSICYEETFGDIIRQLSDKGAHLLINLTSDVWYPNSRLPKQHRDHARLRTVENGSSLLRACNTGVTCAFDSLGNTIAVLGDESPHSEWISDALYVEAPTYHYQTLYAWTGDKLIVIACFSLLAPLLYRRKRG